VETPGFLPINSFKRAVASVDTLVAFKGKVGDMVLKFVAVRDNSLEPLYQGPFLDFGGGR
jgi:hypothetical protein